MSKKTAITRNDVSRIVSTTAINNGGKIPPKSFATRADATVQRRQAATESQGRNPSINALWVVDPH